MVECIQQPFALSLSKGATERLAVSSLHLDMGFDVAQPERIF
jgi:hypothetical protein